MNRLCLFERDTGQYLAYDQLTPSSEPLATVVFLHGFMSDRGGEKAIRFRDALLPEGFSFVAADFQGHGESTGTMEGLTGSRLLSDVARVVEGLCSPGKPLVLIGSSMGGWAASWYAALHPARVAACVLIAPAFTFGELLCRDVGKERLVKWAEEGRIDFRTPYGEARLSFDLIRDLERYPMKELSMKLKAPTLILHGMVDEAVPYLESVGFAAGSVNPDMEVVLLRHGDHRLTAQKDFLARRAVMFLSEHGLGLGPPASSGQY